MAGSRRSPVLRDQWRATSDTRDPRDRERHRPRGSYRDRGRDKFRDRERRRRPKEGRPDDELPLRSPPPRPFPPPPHHEPRQHRDLSPSTISARGSPGHPHPEFHPGRKLGRHRSPLPADYPGVESRRSLEAEVTTDRGHPRRDHSPSAPPPFKLTTWIEACHPTGEDDLQLGVGLVGDHPPDEGEIGAHPGVDVQYPHGLGALGLPYVVGNLTRTLAVAFTALCRKTKSKTSPVIDHLRVTLCSPVFQDYL
ncbi:Thymidylate kinase family protein [Aspergillus niger]|uniref:Thymidylate kinase family protein n=1 Tax=Aspergillus niger TaxID=5061 RepID=A0A505I4F8_ASPNG|nr:Thymidylate kinase family protein [Aspergillus niger]